MVPSRVSPSDPRIEVLARGACSYLGINADESMALVGGVLLGGPIGLIRSTCRKGPAWTFYRGTATRAIVNHDKLMAGTVRL